MLAVLADDLESNPRKGLASGRTHRRAPHVASLSFSLALVIAAQCESDGWP